MASKNKTIKKFCTMCGIDTDNSVEMFVDFEQTFFIKKIECLSCHATEYQEYRWDITHHDYNFPYDLEDLRRFNL